MTQLRHLRPLHPSTRMVPRGSCDYWLRKRILPWRERRPGLNPSHREIGFSAIYVLSIDIQLQRPACFHPRHIQQAASNAAEPPIFLNKEMIHIRLIAEHCEEPDHAGIWLFCDPAARSVETVCPKRADKAPAPRARQRSQALPQRSADTAGHRRDDRGVCANQLRGARS